MNSWTDFKKVFGTHKYYLTKLGKAVILLGLKTKELFIVPEHDKVDATANWSQRLNIWANLDSP